MNTRAPCHRRIVTDSGTGFLIGLVGSTIFFSIRAARKDFWKHRGLYHSINVFFKRRTKKRIFKISAAFGRWTLLFSFYDCAIATARGVDDVISPILAGGLLNSTNHFFKKSRKLVFPNPRRKSSTKFFLGSIFNRKWHKGWKRRFVYGCIFLGVIEGLSTAYGYLAKGDDALYVYEPFGEPPLENLEAMMREEYEEEQKRHARKH